ncbi:DNA repair protein RecO [Aestuariibacter sp. A3R04]|uniref:DNA repair protein RecO n=1 Tax=Aestuariibacter sp. A3R04 TaxID=2841571 RepID=UPI002090ED8A|nr:DNA repair protein RecO [Aestuariibacter sp. A3R04]
MDNWLRGYVLHRRAYRETSYIVDFFSFEAGRVSAVAKGIRNSKSDRKSLLQPFRPLRFQLTGKTDLKNVKLLEDNGNALVLHGKALFCALYLNEVINRILPQGLACEWMFERYQQALDSLVTSADLELTLREFEFSLLEEMGMLADWFSDGASGEPIREGAWYIYSAEQGYVLSQQLDHKYRIPGSALLALGEGTWSSEARRAAKLINRQALNVMLGGKPLKSRELFR